MKNFMNMHYHVNRIIAELDPTMLHTLSDADLRLIAKTYCLAAWPDDMQARFTREVKLFGALKLRRDMSRLPTE